MKFLKKILSKFLIYKIFAFIESLINYYKDYNLISDTLYSYQFKTVLNKYLNCEFEKDWLGRLYGVINPNIDINGNIDISSIIIELDDENTNNSEHIKNWIYRQMELVSYLFKIERLYEYISLDIKHIGPENHDNYLIVFDMISRKYMTYCLKKMLKHLFVYLIIIGIVIGLLIIL